MSRSDLDAVQNQLKAAIQNHQLLISQVRTNPKDVAIQKQVQDYQIQITKLSEKQRSLIQILRKEIIAQTPNGTQINNNNTTTTANLTRMAATSSVRPIAVAAPRPRPRLPATRLQVPAGRPLVTVAHALSSRPQIPVVVAQAPTARSQVRPQVAHRPFVPGSVQHVVPIRPKITQELNHQPKTSANHRLLTTINSSSNHLRRSSSPSSNHKTGSYMTSQIQRTNQIFYLGQENYGAHLFRPVTVDPLKQKHDFMAYLELVSPERVKELQSKRSERKRRTTANPNFSYSNYLSERKFHNYLSNMNNNNKRHRHRLYEGFTSSRSGSPNHNGAFTQNGLLNGAETEDIHDDYCAVCRRSGQLLMCDTCSLVYHLHCLNPVLSEIPTGSWHCPKCQVPSHSATPRPSSTPPLLVLHTPLPSHNPYPQQPGPPHTSHQSIVTLQAPLSTPQATPLSASHATPLSALHATLLSAPQATPLLQASVPRPHSTQLTQVIQTPQPLPAAQTPLPSQTLLPAPQLLHSSPAPAPSPSQQLPPQPPPAHTHPTPPVAHAHRHVSTARPASAPGGINTTIASTNDSVAILRAVKEEERRKLLDQHNTLKADQLILQQKAQQLSSTVNAQLQTKSDLMQSVNSAQQSIDAIHKFIQVFKT